MFERYKVLKELYKEYLILIIKDNKYKTFNYDKDIFDIFYKRDIKKLTDINYIVLDGLEIIQKVEYKNNEYYNNLKKVILINLIEKYRIKEMEKRTNEEENSNNNK